MRILSNHHQSGQGMPEITPAEILAQIRSRLPVEEPAEPVAENPTEPTTEALAEPETDKPKKPKKPKVDPYPEMFTGLQPPLALNVSRTIGTYILKDRFGREKTGVLHLAGKGPRPCDVLFVSPCVLQEELEDRYGKPEMLKGPAASLFLRSCKKVGFDPDVDFHYTTVVRYNIKGLKPKSSDIRWAQPLFHNEMLAIKPKIVVCLGKAPLDLLLDMKVKIDDVRGGFLFSDKYQCQVYAMDTIVLPLTKPEYIERFVTDLKQVYFEMQAIKGTPRIQLAKDYHTIENADQLEQLVDDLNRQDQKCPAVDSEWAGQTYVDGTLRLFQMCWKPGSAAAVKLLDETGTRTMNVDNTTVGSILGRYLARPDVKYIGHFAAADLVWMNSHFGLPIYKKVAFDTMFAQQLVDEYADLKLERLSVRYTDCGRYDLELYLWKKTNKVKASEGYGRVPDRILIPYSLLDTDVTKRVHPILLKQIIQQNLQDYYFKIQLPFVTDCYASWMMTGLPINREYAEQTREVFLRNQKLILIDFKQSVRNEANVLFIQRLRAIDPQEAPKVFSAIRAALGKHNKAASLTALQTLKDFSGPEHFPTMLPLYEHWIAANEIDLKDLKEGFNHASVDHMKRWVFDVKGLTPIKTTKKDGIQMAWEKVLQMPPEKQIEFEPACDKQTVKIYAEQDPLIARVQELKSISNIVKGFLREAEVTVDETTGETTTEEEGIFKWIQSDGRIHPNYSSTETGLTYSLAPASRN